MDGARKILSPYMGIYRRFGPSSFYPDSQLVCSIPATRKELPQPGKLPVYPDVTVICNSSRTLPTATAPHYQQLSDGS